MALPEGVTTCTVTAGVPVTHSGSPVKTFVSIEPSAFLVHAATGTPLVDFLEELNIAEGVAGQFTLPHTDQAGFQDENGNAYTNWYYTARVTYSTPSKAKNKAPKVKQFQLTTGQSTVDLDQLPSGAPALPYIAPSATVSAFHGRTGPITLQESDLPSRLSAGELSATILDEIADPLAAAVGPKLDKTAAAATYAPLAGKLSPIAGSNQWASVGAATGNSHNSIQPYAAAEDMTHVAPVYMFGGFAQEDTPAGIAASITVRAAVEYPEGTIRPLFFRGQRSITIEPGGVVTADPLAHTIPKGALFFIRTFVTKPIDGTGNFIFNHQTGTFTTSGTSFTTSRSGNALDGAATGTGLTDMSLAGTIPSTAGIPSYVPWAVFGQSAAARIAVMLQGTSLTRGQGASGNIGSWAHQALNQAEALANRSTKLLTKYGWISSATSGDTVANLVAVHGMRMAPLRACTHALGEFGTNDIGTGRTDAQIMADLTTVWKINAQCNLKSYYGTIPPQSTSTDGWATLTNQTAGNLVKRSTVNDWLRDGAPLDPVTLLPVSTGTSGAVRAAYQDGATITPASGPAVHPLTSAFELADAVESSRNSGKWRIDQGVMTTDGTHPNAAAYKLMGTKAAPVVAAWTV